MTPTDGLTEAVQSSDIGSTEFWANVRHTFQQTQIPSLAKSLLAPYQMTARNGKILNIVDSNEDNDVKLSVVSADLEVTNLPVYSLDISREAVEDFVHLNYNPVYTFVDMFCGYCNRAESKRVIDMFKTHGVDAKPVTMSDPKNAETTAFEVMQKTQSCVLQMNSKHLRTYYAFAVLPYEYASAVMATYAYTTGKNTSNADEFLVADIGLTKYYVNPDPKDKNCYVGLKHPTNKALCAGSYGMYKNTMTISTGTTDNLRVFIHNGSAIGMSPLHTKDDPMIMKFAIS